MKLQKLKEIICEVINESENNIFDVKLVKAIENWVFKNDKKYINIIAKYQKNLPNTFKTVSTLYRAMILPQSIIDELKQW